jgi:predicted ester cyclase
MPPNREGEKRLLRMHRAAFADAEATIDDQIAEGDKVVTRWTFRSTHKGKFMGIAPTGKRVTITGINIHRIEGGKIVELWRQKDVLGLMQQLGAVRPRRRKKPSAKDKDR